MSDFTIADLHFGHFGIITFENGRVQFKTTEEHDQFIIDNWNAVVKPQDKVYVLGDVAMNRRCISTIDRCNGKKILIKGNHDEPFKLKEFTPYFEDVKAYKIFSKEKVILSHIPIHPQCMTRWRLNIHGHLHDDFIFESPLVSVPDSFYKCVSCEQINYTPVKIEDLINDMG